MFCKIFKKFQKIIAGCILGAGVRYALDPNFTSDGMVSFDCDWLNHCRNQKNLGKIGGKEMTIVVKKVPKPLRGIVKFIFGIKNT